MKRAKAIAVCLAAGALAIAAAAPAARSQGDQSFTTGPKLDLSAAQRRAIYEAVSKDKNKPAPKHFPTAIGADVPPMIELNPLPDDAAAANPAVKFYEYTVVQDQVVLVDPTRMRVVEIIGPPPRQ